MELKLLLLVAVIVCIKGYTYAQVCPVVCNPNPCEHGGTCNDLGGCYRCDCSPSYTGDNCDIDTCDPPCQNDGTCLESGCLCAPQFTGETCETPICNPDCMNGGECVDGQCECPPAYTGYFCETPRCDPACQNGGTCVESTNECVCLPNYTGDYCQTPLCDPDCQNGGTCTDGECICPPSYTGVSCETPLCNPDCQNGGYCDDGHCKCPPLYTGQACETPIQCPPSCPDDCNPQCKNGGYCREDQCICPPSYTGEDCGTPISPGDGWNCDDKNPCTYGNIYMHHYRWPYDGNCTQYILCTDDTQCFIMNCAAPTVWNPFKDTCTAPTEQWPCYPNTTEPIVAALKRPAHKDRRMTLRTHRLTKKNII